MSQPDESEKDRTPPDAVQDPDAQPADATDDSTNDDVEGHAFTGALKDKDRLP